MKSAVLLTTSALAVLAAAQQTAYGQCGGQGWTGATSCVSGYTCTYSNDFYSQCVPGTAATTASTKTTTTKSTTTSKTTTTKTSTTKTSTTKTSTTKSTTTPIQTTLSTTTTAGPTTQVPSGSFTVEGFARNNPTGTISGGAGGSTTTVSAYAAFTSAVKSNTAKVVYVSGIITLTAKVKVGSNTSILGLGSNSGVTGKTLSLSSVDNIIIRNMKISEVKGDDLITISSSTRVWIDHNELFNGGLGNGPDYYDGQIDIIHASDYITVSWNYFHDHWKCSLVGNSDSNRAEDFGHLHVTYHHNYWKNMGTRGPAGRFGHQHIYNNLYEDYHYQAIHSRSDNQVLVEGNVFRGDTPEALSTYGLVIPMDSPNTCTCGDQELDGYANLGAANDWGSSTYNITRTGTFTSAGYSYNLTPLSSVESIVKAGVGVGKI
ncbi:hypothetical protein H072_6315 [Dactylellina haptotyla CBS 200.50]|uniref:CBM1 domain-containing protein n=1 Tax=Dactylellina haptotyla (strain CBS 200.50) TaxID=1284197 RepID=S8AFC0_DACHA|nr:hypothetical protein H072_6315 [Dactylellina haptotyla CBS 200.50]